MDHYKPRGAAAAGQQAVIDLHEEVPGILRADVAVIGAGAAGIAVARRLLADGLRIILIESGGIDYERATADLNHGSSTGQEYYPLHTARLRFFGGTTAIWGGRCAELDPIDLQPRPWVPHSGWPLDWAELRRHYDEALPLFGFTDPPAAAASAAVGVPPFAADEIRTPFWIFDRKFDRFRFDQCHDLLRHPKCTILIHATVREIVAGESGDNIARLDIGGLGGQRAEVQARYYVLAAGGIENPRLLLASNSVRPEGLGNADGNVGRFFMEHPHARGGRIVDASSWALLKAFGNHARNGLTLAPLIAASEALQEREGLLNTSLTIAARTPPDGQANWAMRTYLHAKHRTDPTQFGRALWKTTKRTVKWLQRRTDPFRPWLLHRLGKLDIALVVRAEQAPNPDSRITLSTERDALGLPRARLDWRTSALDVDSVAGLVAALGRESRRLGLGRVEPAEWLSDPSRSWQTDPLISTHAIGGYHHMGTTRMSENPRRGVTDSHGRVHGIDNLYVAGSSLFPTSGWANPTLTIVALALRTAEAIAQKARRPGNAMMRQNAA